MRYWWNHLLDRGRRPGVRRAGVAALGVALVALTLSGVSALAGSQPAGATVKHAHGGHALALDGSIPRAISHATRGARENGTRELTIAVTLGVQTPGALEQLIKDQQNPKSASYHKYLTSQAFTDKFGGSPAAVAEVRAFLQTAGFRVTGVSANRLQINATGTVAQAERAFQTTISQYQLDKRTIYSPDSEPLLPDALAEYVVGITGLDNVAVFKPLLQRAAQAPTHPASGPNGGFDPTELRAAYDVTSLIGAGGTGNGQHIAVFELAPYLPGDIYQYRTTFNLPVTTLTNINNHSIDGALVTCGAGGFSCDVSGVGEADLDLEIVSALAPNATQDIYTGPNTRTGVLDTYQAIVTANVAKVVTTSWGLCEAYAGNAFMRGQDNIFAQAAAQGQTIYAAAGDHGSDDCQTGGSVSPSVDSPASDPYVVGVGGTSLVLAAGPSYGYENAWNDWYAHNNPIATGGGQSTYFDRPSWQQVPNTFGPPPLLRLVPDVSASADPYAGYAIYCSSVPDCGGVGWYGNFGGTSAAAPLWAAITADMNTYLLASSKPTVGWINLTLYQLQDNAQTYAPFHDIMGGGNTVNSTPGYNAYPCFDAVSGVGTPDAWNIARDLAGSVATAGGGPCAFTPATSVNLIQNGGFEAGTPAPWQEFSQRGYEEILPYVAHTGTTAFLPCGFPSCDDRVWQTVTVPSSVGSAWLVYWVDAFSWLQYSTPPLACLDHFYVTLATPDGTVFFSTDTCATNTFGYTAQAVNVTTALQTHHGQPVIVMIRATTSGLAGDQPYSSGWNVDDVSLTVS